MYVMEPTCISAEAAPRPPCLPRPHPSWKAQVCMYIRWMAKLLARTVCRLPPGRWRLQRVRMDLDGRKERHRHCMHSSAQTQALQVLTHTTSSAEYFRSLVTQTLPSDPPRRTPSSFLTGLLGVLQLCQMCMYQAAVVQLPPFPRAEALPPHKMDRLYTVHTSYHGTRTLKLRSRWRRGRICLWFVISN